MSKEDVIAVFPLPDVVFFPYTNLPLHIFEPRYVQMVEDTLTNKQLIGMFIFDENWDPEEYYGNPPVHPIGCAGELIYKADQPEGKFDIVLRGLYRVRIIEFVQELPYRTARVEILPDVMPEDQQLANAMTDKLQKLFMNLAQNQPKYDSSKVSEIRELPELVNQIANALALDTKTKMLLLTQDDVRARADFLTDLLEQQISLYDWMKSYKHLRPGDPSQN